MESNTPAAAAPEPRTGIGRLFRRILVFVDKQGLRDQVLARVSPETAQLMAEPPTPSTWILSPPIEDVYEALEAIGGDALVFKLGMDLSRGFGATIAGPILRAAFAMFGSKPASAFKVANAAYEVASRGIHLEYVASSPTEGILSARFDPPQPGHAILVVVQGTSQWLFELLDVEGSVGPPMVRSQGPGQTVVAYEVRMTEPDAG